jgi:hypothetical protein
MKLLRIAFAIVLFTATFIASPQVVKQSERLELETRRLEEAERTRLESAIASRLQAQSQSKAVDVEFKTGDQNWAVYSTAVGKAVKQGPFLNVVLGKYTMRVDRDYKFGPVRVLGYKIGLVEKINSGGWQVARWSDTKQGDFILTPGQTRQFDNVRFDIPIDGIATKDRWLVICVETKTGSNSNVGHVYSHSSLQID